MAMNSRSIQAPGFYRIAAARPGAGNYSAAAANARNSMMCTALMAVVPAVTAASA